MMCIRGPEIAVISAVRMLRQTTAEFKASLGHIPKPCLRKKIHWKILRKIINFNF